MDKLQTSIILAKIGAFFAKGANITENGQKWPLSLQNEEGWFVTIRFKRANAFRHIHVYKFQFCLRQSRCTNGCWARPILCKWAAQPTWVSWFFPCLPTR
jgi:hypothetical protein